MSFGASAFAWIAALLLIGPLVPASSPAAMAAVVLPSGATGDFDAPGIQLQVPLIRQRPERCGPAALAMVLRFHGAEPSHVALADSAYDPVLRGALITDLAASARRAGFEARVARLTADSLIALLRSGLPPVLLYQRGVGPVSRQHYGVLVGWDSARDRWTLHDGGGTPRRMTRHNLESRWKTVGAEALIVRPLSP